MIKAFENTINDFRNYIKDNKIITLGIRKFDMWNILKYYFKYWYDPQICYFVETILL